MVSAMSVSASNPLCSIIITLFDKEQTIRDRLKSIQEQTVTSLEILVIDDGATDHSVQIVEEIMRDDSRMVLIRESDGAYFSPYNIGLDTALGTCVSFLDPGDRLDPRFLEELSALMQREHTDVARCAQLLVGEAPWSDWRAAISSRPPSVRRGCTSARSSRWLRSRAALLKTTPVSSVISCVQRRSYV